MLVPVFALLYENYERAVYSVMLGTVHCLNQSRFTVWRTSTPWALEKVKLHEAWHFLEVTVPRHPNVLERCFGTLGDAKAVHGDKHNRPPISTALSNQINRSSARGASGVSQDDLSFLVD
jgi:hypothetical protein